MRYKIIIDSCWELTDKMKESGVFQSVPLFIDIDGTEVTDDATFDQASFLKQVAASPNCPKSSCPTPESYMEAIKGEAEEVYIVTLSSKLSGSHNSAILGKSLYEEKFSDKNIHVFDSKGAAIGETLIGMKIKEYLDGGASFLEIVEKVEDYIEEQKIFFVLESLETLKKNGRLTGLKSVIATALSIKPVMAANSAGEIIQLSQARGIKKALVKLVDEFAEVVGDQPDKILGIAQCNCPERALDVKKMILAKMKVKDVVITETAGISTLYANDGGIIVTI